MVSKILFITFSILFIVTGGSDQVPEHGHGSPWMWAIFGIVLYNYLVFNLTKDEVDETPKNFSLRAYTNSHWDNWVWSILCVPVIVYFGDDIFYYAMSYFEKDWEFRDVAYLLAGALAEVLYYLLKKGKMIIKALGSMNKKSVS